MYRCGRVRILSIGLAMPALAHAQSGVAVRELAPVEATSQESLKSVIGVRPLVDGSLLVNDGVRRQLIILDHNLAFKSVLLDSTSDDGRSYGPFAAPTIPYLADSTLFVDGTSMSLVLIDPSGHVTRVISAPSARDLRALAYTASGTDALGNLVYRGINGQTRYRPADPGHPLPPFQFPDSAPIVRANFATRAIDTVGRVREKASVFTNSVMQGDGSMHVTKTINPLTTVDEWAVLSEGSIAFIRGYDYHIDWISPNGTKHSSTKLPFDWKRLTDNEKLALVDSARRAEEKLQSDARLGAKTRADARGNEVASASVKSPVPVLQFVPLGEMSDYYPAIRAGAAKADLDSALWILPTTSAQSKRGELIYDVVNNRGVLAYRVRLPLNRSIVGFGHNGVVYLAYRDDNNIWHIERTRVVR